MRLLADENFPGSVIDVLSAQGHDILAAARTMAGAADSEILARACAEKRWLLTFDTDFGDLVFLHHQPAPPVILLLRFHPIKVPDVLAAVERALVCVPNGHLAVISHETTRLRHFSKGFMGG